MTGETGRNAGAVVFLGPSLSHARARELLPGARILPPARHGDVYRAVRDNHPSVVGLMDGIFPGNASPGEAAGARLSWGGSVSHRELLWALSEGVRVLGAASMGALRCAETHSFGAEPVGKVAHAFLLGRYPPFDDAFEDDDEVALAHAPAELGWLPASTAMVDIRESLAAAEVAGVIGRDNRDALCRSQKALHFTRRGLDRLAGDAPGAAGREGERLAAWLRAGGAVSQKQRDAEELLRRIAGGLGPAPIVEPWEFERTAEWERFRAVADLADAFGGAPA